MWSWFRHLFLGVGGVVAIATLLLGLFTATIWYKNSYKSLIQILEVRNSNTQFLLLTDISGFGDRAWYVYQLPVGAEVTSNMKAGRNKDGVLFWNYSEAGDHQENPGLEIHGERYLVFSRGGYYHSVYDISSRRVLVNHESPWHSFIGFGETEVEDNEILTKAIMRKEMSRWIEKNLHKRIEEILSKK